MADVWEHILLLLLTHQTARVCSLEICTQVQSCDGGFYCCRTAPNGCCPEAERTEATAWIVVGVMAMLAAGGYGFWKYKVAQRMIRFTSCRSKHGRQWNKKRVKTRWLTVEQLKVFLAVLNLSEVSM
ncbi:uncharacterized protein LOC126273003 isoform X2 [Schistocerca gregaria]|uniref:uncharacterized protein LOC126273003 isoform X2 n=1 Tax=Schistocerca gregaria TaxID=7010 RepID=UPI00211F2708|nr:uncharacterized protein LOC126273003 isoform X2 [Schistocerca gregaria]